MKFAWKVEVPQWIILAAMFVAAAIAWPNAPDRIPVHWNISGRIDRYGGKFEGLLLMPLVSLGMYLLLLLLPRIDPGRANYAKFTGAYAVIRIALLGVFAAFYAGVQGWVWTGHLSTARFVPAGMGVLAIVLGAVLGKIQPNWFVGVRTPWTLSSKLSWERTHRAAGWVFMAVGLVTIVSSAIDQRLAFWVLVGGLIGGSVCLIVYSYIVWRSDPDKVPPAGTLPVD